MSFAWFRSHMRNLGLTSGAGQQRERLDEVGKHGTVSNKAHIVTWCELTGQLKIRNAYGAFRRYRYPAVFQGYL